MIAFLEGEVVEKSATHVVLAVAGVGYDVAVPTAVVAGLPPIGGDRADPHTDGGPRGLHDAVRVLHDRRARRCSISSPA
jgi:Holliday junction resolvasome, DNA-binding subunit